MNKKIQKIYYVVMIVLVIMVITNPGMKSFNEFLPKAQRKCSVARDSQWFVCSVYTVKCVGANNLYLGIFGNFFKIR